VVFVIKEASDSVESFLVLHSIENWLENSEIERQNLTVSLVPSSEAECRNYLACK